jgi:hypothetical protein
MRSIRSKVKDAIRQEKQAMEMRPSTRCSLGRKTAANWLEIADQAMRQFHLADVRKRILLPVSTQKGFMLQC